MACVNRLIADKIDANNDGIVNKAELKAWITHSAKRLAYYIHIHGV